MKQVWTTFLFTVDIMTILVKLEENKEMTIHILKTLLAKVGYDDDDDEEIFPTSPYTLQRLHEVEKN